MEIPEALFVFYDNYIVEDLEKEELYITARGILKDAQESLDILEAEIKECKEAPVPEKAKNRRLLFRILKRKSIKEP